MTEFGSLGQFALTLNRDVVADIESWRGDHPLAGLRTALIGHQHTKNFLDTYVEAMLGRQLLQRGCELELEVPTPHGKACDFFVRSRPHEFYVHLKRLDTDHPSRKRLTISSRLRYLERIDRPFIVSVRWKDRARDAQMQRLVRSAREFILHAHVGDELVVHDDDGTEIGGVLIVAPWDGPHVSLVIGLPGGFIDETERMRRLLRRAYVQFMPRATNVIVICSSAGDDRGDFQNALLGSHVERWDTFPPRGRRIAHGRAEDGIWHARRYADSAVAGWAPFSVGDAQMNVDLWFRDGMGVEPPLRERLSELLRAPE